MSPLVQARVNRLASALLQEREGIKSAAEKLTSDMLTRRNNLAAHRAKVQADAEFDAETKAALEADIDAIEAELATTIDAVYSDLTGS